MTAVSALERVTATRYVTPLREGGSLPGLVEADDDGIYVLKFRGAGQGVKVLVAEILVTEIARLLAIPVPRPGPGHAWTRRSPSTRPTRRSRTCSTPASGSTSASTSCPARSGTTARCRPPRTLAARIVWLDALTANVDRTWNNPNLLALARPHVGDRPRRRALLPPRLAEPGAGTRCASPAQRFDVSTHVLRDVAGDPARRHDELAATLTPAVLGRRRRGSPTSGWSRHRGCRTPPRSGRHTSRCSLPAWPAPTAGFRRWPRDRVPVRTLRCVPRVEREEFVNVGVVLYAQSVDFLESAHHVDEDRLRALAPTSTSRPSSDLLEPCRRYAAGTTDADCPTRRPRAAVRLADRAAVDHRAAQPAARRSLRRPRGRAPAADGHAGQAVTLG